MKILNALRFCMKDCMQKVKFWSMLLRESDIICFIRASSKSMILNWQNYVACDFEIKLYKVSDFEMNSEKRVRNWKLFAFKKSRFEPCYSVEATFFAFSLLIPDAWFWYKNFSLRQIRNLKDQKKSFFRLKFLQCITFWTKTSLQPVNVCLAMFEMCQNSKNIAFKKSPFC